MLVYSDSCVDATGNYNVTKIYSDGRIRTVALTQPFATGTVLWRTRNRVVCTTLDRFETGALFNASLVRRSQAYTIAEIASALNLSVALAKAYCAVAVRWHILRQQGARYYYKQLR